MEKEAVSPITVLIVSDNHIIRSGLRRILECHPPFRVLAEMSVEKAHEFHTTGAESPDLIIIDLDSRGTSGLHLISALQRIEKTSPVLALIDLGDHELGTNALTLGARGLVLKTQPASVLLAAIYELCRPSGLASTSEGKVLSVTPTTLGKQVGLRPNLVTPGPERGKSKITSLTARELEVIRLIALGLKNKDIAKRLAISDITVRHHLTNIFCKLEVSDRQNLLILAHRYGLVNLGLNAESA